MNMRTRNQQIINRIHPIIAEDGLEGKLDVYPVENVCTRRPRYWNDGDTNLFKLLMWTVNKLPEDELESTLHLYIDNAKEHFGL